MQFAIQTEKGVKGRLIQDVITSPPSKHAKIFTENSSMSGYVITLRKVMQ